MSALEIVLAVLAAGLAVELWAAHTRGDRLARRLHRVEVERDIARRAASRLRARVTELQRTGTQSWWC